MYGSEYYIKLNSIYLNIMLYLLNRTHLDSFRNIFSWKRNVNVLPLKNNLYTQLRKLFSSDLFYYFISTKKTHMYFTYRYICDTAKENRATVNRAKEKRWAEKWPIFYWEERRYKISWEENRRNQSFFERDIRGYACHGDISHYHLTMRVGNIEDGRV